MSSMPEGFSEVAGGIVAVALIVLVLTIVVGPVASSLGVSTSDGGNQTTSEDIVGGSETFGSDVVGINFVKADLNGSVRLTGANDSNVTIESDANLGHDLSACTWGELDSSVVSNNEDALLLATQEAITWYNGTADEWRGYYYNTSSRNSFRASVNATDPTNATLVCLNHANQSLNVSENTTTGSSVATGSSNVADYPDNVTNWNGTVEETRLFATPLNGSQRTEWVGEPGLAVQGPAPATRVTYDTFADGKTNYVTYFASGSATASNATQVGGFDAPAPTDGVDYSISGGTITLLDGGQFEADGEVVYISYTAEALTGPMSGALSALFNMGEAALVLVVMGIFALAGFAVLNQLGEF